MRKWCMLKLSVCHTNLDRVQCLYQSTVNAPFGFLKSTHTQRMKRQPWGLRPNARYVGCGRSLCTPPLPRHGGARLKQLAQGAILIDIVNTNFWTACSALVKETLWKPCMLRPIQALGETLRQVVAGQWP
jgi:hypothetical protein